MTMFRFLNHLFGTRDNEWKEVRQQDPVILDVRTPAEYREGHITGSLNIPLDELQQKTLIVKQWNKPVITVCRSGNRSRLALGILAAAGIKAYNGGAWKSFQNSHE